MLDLVVGHELQQPLFKATHQILKQPFQQIVARREVVQQTALADPRGPSHSIEGQRPLAAFRQQRPGDCKELLPYDRGLFFSLIRRAVSFASTP